MQRILRSRAGHALAALLIASSVAAACSDDDPSSSGSSTPSGDEDAGTTTDDQSAEMLGESNPATLEPVKVGLIVPEGGLIDTPELGDAAEAAAEYANEYLGGLGGHPIQVTRCSDRSDNVSGAACANQMVEEGVSVVVIAGAVSSSDAIVPIVVGADIPYVASVGGSVAELTTPGTFFWTGGGLSVLGGEAQYAQEQGLDSVNYFVIDSPAAVGGLQAIGQVAYDAAGVELRVTPIPADTPDPTSLVTAALADEPSAVALLADPALCRSVLSALATAGSTVPVFLNAPCVSDEVFEALGDDALNGDLVFRTDEVSSGDDEVELFDAVMNEYAPGLDPDKASGGYQSMLGLVRAVNAAGLQGDATPANVLDAIGRATNVPLPVGHGIAFSCDHPAIDIPLIQGRICSAGVIIETLEGGSASDTQVVEPGSLFEAS